ncbi:MAG TPA: hypothetical protein VF756_29830 [Thermoanaerobaculia bacterium]
MELDIDALEEIELRLPLEVGGKLLVVGCHLAQPELKKSLLAGHRRRAGLEGQGEIGVVLGD